MHANYRRDHESRRGQHAPLPPPEVRYEFTDGTLGALPHGEMKLDAFREVEEDAEKHFARSLQLWFDWFKIVQKTTPITLTKDMPFDLVTGKFTWGEGHALGTKNVIMLTGLMDSVLSHTTHPGNDYFDAVVQGEPCVPCSSSISSSSSSSSSRQS